MSCTPLSTIFGTTGFQTFMNDFLSDLENAADDFQNTFNSATEGIDGALKNTSDFLGKANCLSELALRNPKIKRYTEYANFLQNKVNTALSVKNSFSTALGSIDDIIKNQLSSIPFPDLSSNLQGLFSAMDSVTSELQKFQQAYTSAVNSVTKGFGVAACLLGGEIPGPESPLSPLFKLVSDYENLLENASNFNAKINGVNNSLGTIQSFLSGENCIDLTS